MIYLFGGFAALLAGMLAWRSFSTMDPSRVLRILKWTGIALLIAAAIFLLTRQAILPALLSAAAAAALRYQGARGWRIGGGPRPTQGQTSRVGTDWLEMTLDHATGETGGVVLKGRFKGARLAELSLEYLLALRNELRIEDPDAAQLLDAYLSRVHPGAQTRDEPPRGGSTAMTRDEAFGVLGLSEGASEAEIRDAHRRLMQQVHPDRGGSDYLAAKINAARDFLLD